MMKKSSLLLALATFAATPFVSADTIGGNGSWQSWGTGSLTVDSSSPNIGTPYWNNVSGDGPKYNAGWCVSGGGNCTMATGAAGLLPYYGTSTGAASTMYFTNSGNPVTVTLETILTSQTSLASGYDVIGYYIANSQGTASATGPLIPLFNTLTGTPGTTATITSLAAGENYGFYIENVLGQGLVRYDYLMDSTSNLSSGAMPADNLQHFATFEGSNGDYYLGDVNADACQGSYTPTTSPCVLSSQFDYNDAMFEVETTGAATSTPEPMSWALVAGGMVALEMWRRKRRNA